MDKGSDAGYSVPAYLFDVGDVVEVKPDELGTQRYLFDNGSVAQRTLEKWHREYNIYYIVCFRFTRKRPFSDNYPLIAYITR